MHKTKYIDQGNKIEDPNMSTQNFSYLIFNNEIIQTHRD